MCEKRVCAYCGIHLETGERCGCQIETKVYCDCCGCGLYRGDYFYEINGEKLCEDCMDEEYRRIL